MHKGYTNHTMHVEVKIPQLINAANNEQIQEQMQQKTTENTMFLLAGVYTVEKNCNNTAKPRV